MGQLSRALRFHEQLILNSEDGESERPDLWIAWRGVGGEFPVVILKILFRRDEYGVRDHFTVSTCPLVRTHVWNRPESASGVTIHVRLVVPAVRPWPAGLGDDHAGQV